MKKIIIAMLSIVLLLCLCACDGKDADSKPAATQKPSKVTTEPTTGPAECPHAYTDTVTTEATCTAEGVKTFTCDQCGDSYTEPVEKIEHSYVDATCTTPKTCTACGITEGDALDHNYAEATCTKPKTCVNCGATNGKSLGHQYTGVGCTGEKTCTVCGTSKKNSHKYTEATCTAPKTCTVCSATEGDVLDHNYAEATCTTPKTCTVCGATEGEVLEHTCNSDGVCTVCGEQVEAAPENIPFEGYGWSAYVLHPYEDFECLSKLYFTDMGLMDYQYFRYYNEEPPEEYFGTIEHGGKIYYEECIGGRGSYFEFSVDGDTVTVWSSDSETFVMTRSSAKCFVVISSTYDGIPVGTEFTY